MALACSLKAVSETCGRAANASGDHVAVLSPKVSVSALLRTADLLILMPAMVSLPCASVAGPLGASWASAIAAQIGNTAAHIVILVIKPLRDSSYTDGMSVVGNIAAIAKGMSITFREMLEPSQVENYPDGPGPLRGAVFEQRFRGAHVLQRDEDGLEKCVACFLCAAACPANCIYIEADENTAEKRISSSERYAKVYNIDYNRCIFCGYCVEACPTDAITHGHGFELATLNATNLVMRKEDMLLPVSALTAK